VKQAQRKTISPLWPEASDPEWVAAHIGNLRIAYRNAKRKAKESVQ
jgi:hypothetical protein